VLNRVIDFANFIARKELWNTLDPKEVVNGRIADVDKDQADIADELQEKLREFGPVGNRALIAFMEGLPKQPYDMTKPGMFERGTPVTKQAFYNCGDKDKSKAVLVATLFRSDMAIYHTVSGEIGMVTKPEAQFYLGEDKGHKWGDKNACEDEDAPGKHWVTIYLGPGAKINRLGKYNDADDGWPLGWGWTDRSATLWLQPGPAYDGHRLRLHADKADDGFPLKDFDPGFYWLRSVDWDGANGSLQGNRVHEKASGLSVVD